MNATRPKSKLRKRANKAKARVRKAALLEDLATAKAAKAKPATKSTKTAAPKKAPKSE